MTTIDESLFEIAPGSDRMLLLCDDSGWPYITPTLITYRGVGDPGLHEFLGGYPADVRHLHHLHAVPGLVLLGAGESILNPAPNSTASRLWAAAHGHPAPAIPAVDAAFLAAGEHLRGPYVLVRNDGTAVWRGLTDQQLQAVADILTADLQAAEA